MASRNKEIKPALKGGDPKSTGFPSLGQTGGKGFAQDFSKPLPSIQFQGMGGSGGQHGSIGGYNLPGPGSRGGIPDAIAPNLAKAEVGIGIPSLDVASQEVKAGEADLTVGPSKEGTPDQQSTAEARGAEGERRAPVTNVQNTKTALKKFQ